MSPLRIVEADLSRPDQQADVVAMTAAYALDEMGNGGPLAADVLERLVPGLRALPTTLLLLAYAGAVPVGIATCFRSFSTFLASPVVNIHDFFVVPAQRGSGIARALLSPSRIARVLSAARASRSRCRRR